MDSKEITAFQWLLISPDDKYSNVNFTPQILIIQTQYTKLVTVGDASFVFFIIVNQAATKTINIFIINNKYPL